jgi:small-conductance mechanosensitive channel
MTQDGNHLRLPNALVFKAVMVNYTRNGERRFEFVLPIAPDSDVALAMRECIAAVRATPDVMQTPEAFVQVAGVTREEIQLQCYGWVDQHSANFGTTRSEAIRRSRARLQQTGIDFGPPILRLVETRDETLAEPVEPVEGDGDALASERESLAAVAEAVKRTRVEMGSSDLLTESAPRE